MTWHVTDNDCYSQIQVPGFFPLLKSYIFIMHSKDTIFNLSRVRIVVLPWLLTWLANYKSFLLRLGGGSFEILHTLIALFCCFKNEWKKLCFMWKFHQYLFNSILHGRLGVWILSFHAEIISNTSEGSNSWEILSGVKDKICIPKRSCNILCISNTIMGFNGIS